MKNELALIQMKVEDKDKINIENLVIEITRRCNMKCSHCLRGPAQNKDIDMFYIDILFKHVNYISNLTITGDEPSLKPEYIKWILRKAKSYKIGIGSFFISTNGKKVTPEFLIEIVNLYSYCDDNEISGIRISRDDYHEEIPNNNIKKLQIFSFTTIDDDRHKFLINEGRTKELINYGRHSLKDSRKLNPDEFEFDEENINTLSEGTLYLNVKGNLIRGCDWSYKSQDKPENIFCHVSKFNINKVKEICKKSDN
jgi:hypothetical protein